MISEHSLDCFYHVSFVHIGAEPLLLILVKVKENEKKGEKVILLASNSIFSRIENTGRIEKIDLVRNTSNLPQSEKECQRREDKRKSKQAMKYYIHTSQATS